MWRKSFYIDFPWCPITPAAVWGWGDVKPASEVCGGIPNTQDMCIHRSSLQKRRSTTCVKCWKQCLDHWESNERSQRESSADREGCPEQVMFALRLEEWPGATHLKSQGRGGAAGWAQGTAHAKSHDWREHGAFKPEGRWAGAQELGRVDMQGAVPGGWDSVLGALDGEWEQ